VLVEFSVPGAASELIRLGKNLKMSVFKDVFVERKKSPFSMWYERRMVHFKSEWEKSGGLAKRSGGGLLICATSGTGSADDQVFLHATDFAGESISIRGSSYAIHDPPDFPLRKVTGRIDRSEPMEEDLTSGRLKRKPTDPVTSPGQQTAKRNNSSKSSSAEPTPLSVPTSQQNAKQNDTNMNEPPSSANHTLTAVPIGQQSVNQSDPSRDESPM
jgi:hypothetical protein